MVSGASQFLVQETGIPSGQTSALSEGDTLQRVVSGATFDVSSVSRSANLATLTLSNGTAALLDGLDHVLLEISDGASETLQLPLMVVLPSDLSSNTIEVVLPSDVLTMHGAARSKFMLWHHWRRWSKRQMYVILTLCHTFTMSPLRVLVRFSLMWRMLQHLRTLALRLVGSVQGRVIGVNGDTLTLVLDSPVETIQETLGSGDAAAVATLLSTLAVTQGNAPVFNPTTIRPDLDAALTVDLVAKADLVGLKSVTCKVRLIWELCGSCTFGHKYDHRFV